MSMVEVLVISENKTAVEMVKTVHKVLGAHAVRNLHPLVIKSNYSKARVCSLIQNKMKTFHGKIDGVLLMTEIFGSTQSNLCMEMLDRSDVRLICGYNMPMLIKAATLNQHATLKSLIPKLKTVGRKYIRTFSHKKS